MVSLLWLFVFVMIIDCKFVIVLIVFVISVVLILFGVIYLFFFGNVMFVLW